MINLVEICLEEYHQSPCVHGNIVGGHSCYCHSNSPHAPRKCPIFLCYGEADIGKWNAKGDFNSNKWDGGCKMFLGADLS